ARHPGEDAGDASAGQDRACRNGRAAAVRARPPAAAADRSTVLGSTTDALKKRDTADRLSASAHRWHPRKGRMRTETISVQVRDGTMGAYVAYPDRTPAGAIIAIMEIWGVNDTMRWQAHELAEAGYLCLVPDLFWPLG